jgi:tryptophanyl-tRNA synthetase
VTSHRDSERCRTGPLIIEHYFDSHAQLGNYLGALQNWANLQNDAASIGDEFVFFIASLHAITIPQDPKRLLTEKRDVMAALLAIGLDPHRCILFQQDQVQEHTELAWYLNCLTPLGKLNRMTTWKVSTDDA